MSKAGLWYHKPPRVKKKHHMWGLRSSNAASLWTNSSSSLVLHNFLTVKHPELLSLPRLRCCGTPDSRALSQQTLSAWQDDLCWQGTILHHACFRTDILSTTQVCQGLLHLCDKNRGEGGKASSRLMVSKVPVHCAGVSTAEQVCSHIPADQELESNWNQT